MGSNGSVISETLFGNTQKLRVALVDDGAKRIEGRPRRAAVAVDSRPLKHLKSSAESWCIRARLPAGHSPGTGLHWRLWWLGSRFSDSSAHLNPHICTRHSQVPRPELNLHPITLAPAPQANSNRCDGHGLTENPPTMDTSIQRALNDKLYEKRKVGALEYVLPLPRGHMTSHRRPRCLAASTRSTR